MIHVRLFVISGHLFSISDYSSIKMKFLKLTIYTALFFLTPSIVHGATNVFYSVGQSTSDLKTGSPTVTITSGAAVFSEAQTGNIGVGDRVTYNTSSIAYISAKTNADQMHWTLVTATGGVPADITASTVVSIKHEYTSLNSAAAGIKDVNHLNTGDLVTGNYILNFPCYYDSGEDTSASLSGFTTSSTNYLRIYTPYNTLTEANISQRHNGGWNTQKFIVAKSNGYIFTNTPYYTVFDGLQMKTQYKYGIGGGFANTFHFNNIFYNDSDNKDNSLFYENSGGKADYFINNIFINGGVYYGGSPLVYFYNNTIFNGMLNEFCGGGSFVLKNNLVQGTTDGYAACYATGSDNNISSGDADAPGANSKNSTNVSFADAANKDFHLSPFDTAAKNAGADLSADSNFAFNTDTDGQTRSGSWDIGADEAATAVYYSVGQNTNDHKTGSPTVTIASGTATFSVAQTATNMGVGDKVTYNGSTVAYISAKISTTQWKLITATGSTPADVGTAQTVNSIAHAFSSLNAAVTGASGASYLNTSDLATNNYQLHIPCYYDSGADANTVTISGYTTGESNYIKIYTPTNTVTEANSSQRHQGKWDSGKYYLQRTANNGRMLRVNDDYVKVEGLQISNLGTSYADDVWYQGGGKFYFSHSIVKDGMNNANIDFDGMKTGGSIYIYNNFLYGEGSYYATYYDFGVSGTAYIYNNTISKGTKGGIKCNGSSLNMYVKNNIIQGTGVNYALCAGTNVTANNISQDATSPNSGATDCGGHSCRNQTVSFIDAASGDFHLKSTDASAKGAGVDLQADSYFAFDRDIDGQVRVNPWDIGADQFHDTQVQAQMSAPSLDSGLVGHWTFDGQDIEGTVAKDTSGYVNSGTISGATATHGKLGQGMSFDGSSNYISVSDSNSFALGTGDFTVSTWVKFPFTKTYAPGYWPGIFGKGGADVAPAHGWGFQQKGDTTNSIVWTQSTDAGGAYEVSKSITGISDGWHMLTALRSGTTVQLYLDGAYSTQATGSTANLTNTYSVKFGCDNGSTYMGGSMDDTRVYNRALSSTEIEQLYRQNQETVGAPEASKVINNGLVGYWPLNGPDISGTTAYDRSGNGNNGTITGATVTLGKLGQGLSFNGSSANVAVGNTSQTINSVSFWTKPTSTSQYLIDLDGGTHYVRINSGTITATGFASPTIYVDGSANSTISDTNWHNIIITTATAFSASNMTIGLAASNYFSGLLDDVRIYNRALSDSEISNLYKSGQVEIRKW